MTREWWRHRRQARDGRGDMPRWVTMATSTRQWWADRWRARDERGDVPGWVMITVMTIVVASALLMMFQGAVTDFMQETLDEYM